MRLWPIGLLTRSITTFTTATASDTLFALLAALSLAGTPTAAAFTSNSLALARLPSVFYPAAASSALLLVSAPSFASASPPTIPASQRAFRLGHPAAPLNPRPFSSMSSATLPPQTASFAGFGSTPALDPTPETSQLIRDAMDLFGARPSPGIFTRWSPTAIFADPICHAQGSRQYLAQWYGMPAAFSASETLEWKLTKQHDDAVEYVQKQRYKVKGLGVTKDMISTVVMQRDPTTNKITRFEDRWNHKPLGGFLSWPFRRLNALTLPFLVGVPKETKQAVESGKSTAAGGGPKDL